MNVYGASGTPLEISPVAQGAALNAMTLGFQEEAARIHRQMQEQLFEARLNQLRMQIELEGMHEMRQQQKMRMEQETGVKRESGTGMAAAGGNNSNNGMEVQQQGNDDGKEGKLSTEQKADKTAKKKRMRVKFPTFLLPFGVLYDQSVVQWNEGLKNHRMAVDYGLMDGKMFVHGRLDCDMTTSRVMDSLSKLCKKGKVHPLWNEWEEAESIQELNLREANQRDMWWRGRIDDTDLCVRVAMGRLGSGYDQMQSVGKEQHLDATGSIVVCMRSFEGDPLEEVFHESRNGVKWDSKEHLTRGSLEMDVMMTKRVLGNEIEEEKEPKGSLLTVVFTGDESVMQMKDADNLVEKMQQWLDLVVGSESKKYSVGDSENNQNGGTSSESSSTSSSRSQSSSSSISGNEMDV
eukprot:TRINITY_DN1806_c1_g1_i2.p1 TRINITY_DN1806_c1_g1~~TRINITY_DN1806_c1_g1_i2.p1  ORF type:complete len:406 (-),score=128.64 TRINITY_DN1806_c1_g1_i2:78-1295(-)